MRRRGGSLDTAEFTGKLCYDTVGQCVNSRGGKWRRHWTQSVQLPPESVAGLEPLTDEWPTWAPPPLQRRPSEACFRLLICECECLRWHSDCMCVCVCVFGPITQSSRWQTNTHIPESAAVSFSEWLSRQRALLTSFLCSDYTQSAWISETALTPARRLLFEVKSKHRPVVLSGQLTTIFVVD